MMTMITYVFLVCSEDSVTDEQLSMEAQQRDPQLYRRLQWHQEEQRFSERMFYRLFRMHRACFHCLCDEVEKKIGKDQFKSEKYLKDMESTKKPTIVSKLYHARKKTVGSTISGEWKMAITLRMMAGSSYLDMYLWSNISPNHISGLFKDVTKNWINKTLVIDVYGDVLNNSARIESITRDFAVSSDGILKGCIGCIDGWLVSIIAPTLKEVKNPGKYYARKGFYALNVQVICDKQKRAIWRSIGQMGSIHDSRAFHITQLAIYLKSCCKSFMDCGLYFMGDSAYALRPYLMTPYDNATPNSKEDAYNYFLSRNRIYIECVFGEVARRWVSSGNHCREV